MNAMRYIFVNLLVVAFISSTALAQTNLCSNAGGTRSSNLFALDGTFGTAPAGTQPPTLTSSSNPTPTIRPLRYALSAVPGISAGVDAEGRPIGTTTYILNNRNSVNFPSNYSPEDGEYEITNSTYSRQDGAWHRFIGGRNGGGERDLFMFINAAHTPGIFYEQTLTVVPNTNYEFSISVINLIANNASILPNLNLEIDRRGVDDNNNGTVDEAGERQVIALTGNIPNSSTPIWREYGGVINSGASNRIIVRFRNNAPGGGGNDLAIDNLQFTSCTGLATGNISGTIYFDANSNNSLDSGEALGNNIAVELVGRDSNNNPLVVATAQTVNGVYNFTNVPAGTYTIRVPLNEPQLNAATPRNPSATSGGYVVRNNVQLTVNGNVINQNFGFGLPPISVSKTANADSNTNAIGNVIATASAGQTFQYTFRITNNTGIDLSSTSLRLIDALPPGLSYVTGSLQMAVVTTGSPTFSNVNDGGSYPFAEPNGRALGSNVGTSTSSFNNGSLRNSETLIVRFRVTVQSNPPATLSNQGRITYTTSSVARTVLTDDPGVVGLADPTITRIGANLVVTKTASVTSTSPGSTFTYSIQITNNGAVATNNVTLQDVLPTGLSYISNTAEAAMGTNPTSFTSLNATTYPFSSARAIGNNVGVGGFNNNTLGVGQTLTIRFQVQVAISPVPPNSLSNQASITFSYSGGSSTNVLSDDPTIVGLSDPTITPVLYPDLTLSKTHSGNFVRGSTGVYTLEVNNTGQAATAGTITVTDTLPVGLTFASATGWSCSVTTAGPPQVVICTSTASIPAGGSTSFPLSVNVAQNAAANLTNTATVSGGAEANTSNNNASDPTTLESQADVQMVSKTVNNATPAQGSNVTFTLTVRNNGPSNATGVQVSDVLPAGLSFVSSAPSQGSYVAGTGLWTVGSLSAGASATLQITATATQTGSLTNIASKTAQTEPDPDPGNNQAQVSINVTPLGVTVSGRVYHDLQPNGQPETSEDWAGGTPVRVNLVQGSTVVQTLAVNAGTGAYSFSNVVAGSYNIVITNSVASTTPTEPSGWIFVTTGSLSVSVAGSNIANQDFGLFNGSRIRGTVFHDDGLGAGTANDALQNGGEPGIPSILVTASDGNSSRSASTDVSGLYTMFIPASFGSNLTLSQPQQPATGSNVGGANIILATTYASTDAARRTISSFTAGQRYEGYNFGLVRESRLRPDQSGQSPSPGALTYSHWYRPGTLGLVNLAISGGNYAYLLRRDVNCDGDFADAGEGFQTLPQSFVVDAAWPRESDGSLRACALDVQVLVPAGLPAGRVDIAGLQAALRWVNHTALTDARLVFVTTTVATAGGLQLLKEVRNFSRGGTFAATASGQPGEVLEYRIAYQNIGSQPIFNVVLSDPVPFFTTLVQNAYGSGEVELGCPNGSAVRPDLGSVGNITLNLASLCTLNTAPSPSGSGTLPALLPAQGGYFLYRVQVR